VEVVRPGNFGDWKSPVVSFTHDDVVVSACEMLLHRKMRSHVCATNCALGHRKITLYITFLESLSVPQGSAFLKDSWTWPKW
jgi:hypothetical protein